MSGKAGPAKVSNTDFSFIPNQLDKFDNVTYNLKLFIVAESAFITGDLAKIDAAEQIVIAETGVTTQISIDDLEIKSYIGPSRSVRNQESVRFDFVLREYYGAGLLDKIFIASQSLGIKNYYKCPYFLEVTFAGRDTNSSSPDIEANALRWVWPVFIKGIETEVDASGSLYSVESYALGNLGQTDDNGSLSQQINIEADTVGNAIKELEKQLNINAEQEAVTSITIPDTYKITVDPQIAALKLVEDNTTTATAKSSPQATDDRTLRSIALEKHLNIGEAINRIISPSTEYQKESKNTDSASEQEVNDSEKTKKIHRIFSDAKLKAFDLGRGDYAKDFTFDIQWYEMSTLQVGPNESNADGKKKLDNLKAKRLVQKEYNYLYTGVNDQVLNFDLKFNFGWYVNMPSQAGLFTEYTSASEGQHISNVYANYQEIREEISKSRKLVANAPEATRASSASAETERVQQQINNSNLPDAEREQLERLLEASIQSRLPANQQGSYEEKYATAQGTTSRNTGKGSADPTKRFVSDYKVDKESLTTAYKQYPLSYAETRKDDTASQDNKNVEGNKGGGRSYVNTMFEQAFSGKSGDLVNVEIEVKGDPYWLESKEGVESQNSVNSRPGQQSIVFTVQTADLPNETSGIVEHTSSPFSGVYAVRQVDHKFEKGKFTQTLYAVRDPNITTADIAKDTNG